MIFERFCSLRHTRGARLLRANVLNQNGPSLPPMGCSQSSRSGCPHLPNAAMLTNSDDGHTARERAFAKRGALHPRLKPLRLRAPDRRRADLSLPAVAVAPEHPRAVPNAEEDAYRTACIFWEGSSAYRSCASSSYGVVDIVDFLARALRSRARPDNTLFRVTELLPEFRTSDMSPDHHCPLYGEEALVAVTKKWISHLPDRAISAPATGMYAMEVFGEALGTRPY